MGTKVDNLEVSEPRLKESRSWVQFFNQGKGDAVRKNHLREKENRLVLVSVMKGRAVESAVGLQQREECCAGEAIHEFVKITH